MHTARCRWATTAFDIKRPAVVLPGAASAFINHQPLSALPPITLAVSLRNENIASELNATHCVTTDKVFRAITANISRTVCAKRRKRCVLLCDAAPLRRFVHRRARSEDGVCIGNLFASVQMKRLLQLLQQRWLLRSLVQELRTVPTSFAARPCFPREPLLPLPPPLPAPARAPWRLD